MIMNFITLKWILNREDSKVRAQDTHHWQAVMEMVEMLYPMKDLTSRVTIILSRRALLHEVA
jgi:hypothetical protein